MPNFVRMSQTISIMPCLDMQNGRVVKGVHFVDIADAGDPVECARAYCAAGADELAMLDITATVENRPTLAKGRPRSRGGLHGAVHRGRRHQRHQGGGECARSRS